jgi:1-acyl-sn-glycerol-3-phosphate acyltransferase
MSDDTIRRRLITIPVTVVLFLVVSVCFPVLVTASLLVDSMRAVLWRTPAVASRLIVFLWLYLLGEMWALVALAGAGLLTSERSVGLTYRLQGAWAAWTFESMRAAFSLSFREEGLEHVPPAPILVLARHASLVDTMLPARYVTRAHGIRLRYVLKKELLIDPALDIGGNRLPNHFVDRGAAGAEAEVTAIQALAAGMADSEGVMIYPEGTRYSDEKRERYVAPLVRQGGIIGEIASRYEKVLPPRPGGTLALLDATSADVVVHAHRGLEGFATLKDIWSRDLVGSRIDVRLWRVPRSDIPEGRSQRVEWLYRIWADIDAWVSEKRHVG